MTPSALKDYDTEKPPLEVLNKLQPEEDMSAEAPEADVASNHQEQLHS